MMAVSTTVSPIVMMKALKIPVKKTSNIRFRIQGHACKSAIQCLMELMPLGVLATSPMQESLRSLVLAVLLRLTVANETTSNLGTSIDAIHLLTTIITAVNTVRTMMPMLDMILLLAAILTIANTVVTVLKMRGVVAIMIMRIAAMMGV